MCNVLHIDDVKGEMKHVLSLNSNSSIGLVKLPKTRFSLPKEYEYIVPPSEIEEEKKEQSK